jgi:lipopolysaccharide transport system ATP-binding protein
MRRKEIQKNFDAIVDFAGVEKFIDTPLKHYSSGMQLRLAFAVAAFLEAEILVIDEVLAVGDAEFQKKCLGKMEEVSKQQGRTVLFVSHNMGTIRSFCKKGIYLEKGKTKGIDSVENSISEYLSLNKLPKNTIEKELNIEELTKHEAKIIDFKIMSENEKKEKQNFFVDEKILIRVIYSTNTNQPILVNFMLVNESGIKVMIGTDATSDFYSNTKKEQGIYQTDFIIPPYLLNNTGYFVHLSLDNPIHQTYYDFKMNALFFQVTDPINEKSIHRGVISKNFPDVAIWPKLETYTCKLK